MDERSCRRAEAYRRAFHELWSNHRARREWLWLRAREKEDETSIEVLARADPGVRERMRGIDEALGAMRDPRDRRVAYGALLDLRTPGVERVECDCPECAGGALP